MYLKLINNSFFFSLKKIIDELRLSFLPPLLIYLAAGTSGMTSIVGTFYVKEYLNLSASFIASLGFWITLPWALKMPVGHLVDLAWKRKNYFVLVGAFLISLSFLIMFGIISAEDYFNKYLSLEVWFVISSILAPVGFVLQDVVADAMTVEAIPEKKNNGENFASLEIKSMHTTMQTLGRFFIIGGTVLVGGINIFFFKDIEALGQSEKLIVYGKIYLFALIVPLISILGVIISNKLLINRKVQFQPKPNLNIIIGSLVFVIFIIFTGIIDFKYSQEIIFIGSISIVAFLMKNLCKFMTDEAKKIIVGTALIIFIFRSMPNVGIGLSWFEIDILKFDQKFFSILALLASILTMFGILIFRNFMANNSIAKIIVILSILNSILILPSLAMYYGLHDWTSQKTMGIVDARFIAIINTAIESPLGQVSMIPLLAWIAKNAPSNLKATFFAVFASFTNLALSFSNLFTKYLNEIFVVTREVKDKINDKTLINSDYSELGILILIVFIITLTIPILSVIVIQKTKYKTNE